MASSGRREKQRSSLLTSNALFAVAEIDVAIEVLVKDYRGKRFAYSGFLLHS